MTSTCLRTPPPKPEVKHCFASTCLRKCLSFNGNLSLLDGFFQGTLATGGLGTCGPIFQGFLKSQPLWTCEGGIFRGRKTRATRAMRTLWLSPARGKSSTSSRKCISTTCSWLTGTDSDPVLRSELKILYFGAKWLAKASRFC